MAARTRWDSSAYAQDAWRFSTAWSVDYGLLADTFGVTTTDVKTTFSQISPRLKLTRSLSARSSVYAYYGRLFEPYAADNYFESARDSSGIPFATPAGLRPESDSLYEVGAHFPVGKADLGIRLWHKVATNVLDDALIPNTNAQQEINYQQGMVDLQSLYLQQKSSREGKVLYR